MCCPPPAPGGPVVPPAQSRGCLRRNGRSSPGTPDFGQEERPVRLGPEEGSTGQTMVLSWGGGGQHRTTHVYTQVERLTRPDLKKNKYFPVSMVIFIPYSSSKRGTTPNAMENFENLVSSLASRPDFQFFPSHWGVVLHFDEL